MDIQPTAFLITGYARAGKDCLASAIADLTKAKRVAFADELKNAANLLFERFNLHGRVDCRREADKVRHRELLVAMGRSLRAEDRDVFALPVAQSAAYNLRAGRSVVIPDWRYANEYAEVFHKVAPYKLVTIRISRFGLNPANLEESDSIEVLDKTIMYRFNKMFKDGDVAGIRDWAAEIVATLPAIHKV